MSEPHLVDCRDCPACGSPGPFVSHAVDGKLAIGGGPLRLASCERCGLRFQPRVPTDEELAAWYDYMGSNPANHEGSPLLQRRLSRMVSVFDDVREAGRLLEVGCGGGLFARAALAAKWELSGTEISPSCVALLRPLLGPRLHEGTIDTAPFAPTSFDGAVMIEVIEHLSDPAVYLQAIRRFLRPGGRLFLTTPNGRGSAARVLGTDWRVFSDEHLSYFDERSITTLLERFGFNHVRVTTTNLDLLVMAAQRARQLLRPGAPAGSIGAPSSVAMPSAGPYAATARPDLRVRARVAAADLAIDVVNRLAAATRLGDTLRVVATRA